MNEMFLYPLAILGAVTLFKYLVKELGLKEIKLTFFENKKEISEIPSLSTLSKGKTNSRTKEKLLKPK